MSMDSAAPSTVDGALAVNTTLNPSPPLQFPTTLEASDEMARSRITIERKLPHFKIEPKLQKEDWNP